MTIEILALSLSILVIVLTVTFGIVLVNEKSKRFQPLSEKKFTVFLKKHEYTTFKVIHTGFIAHLNKYRFCLQYNEYVTKTSVTGSIGYPVPKIIYVEMTSDCVPQLYIGKYIIFYLDVEGKIARVEEHNLVKAGVRLT